MTYQDPNTIKENCFKFKWEQMEDSCVFGHNFGTKQKETLNKPKTEPKC